eukprot:TRINITY_DN7138_c0_g1_i1.p1 TRINITY_DN7138_c0_g1~~TRINITY_DN7138_c0_g1_i1.p1  ORF type:complete len:190 (+),score=26.74 TRINITY_DN7138_c0_g1_i1:99-668(+)
MAEVVRRLIPDANHYRSLIKVLVKGGTNKLQVVADFDSTITAYGYPHSWSGVEKFREFRPEYIEKARRDYLYYHEKEISTTLPREQKVKYMEEWWKKAHQLLLGEKITRSTWKRMVDDVKDYIKFRDKSKELFDLLHFHSIPCLILSAGIGNVIEIMLSVMDCYPPNVHVISNFVVYESEDIDAIAIGT